MQRLHKLFQFDVAFWVFERFTAHRRLNEIWRTHAFANGVKDRKHCNYETASCIAVVIENFFKTDSWFSEVVCLSVCIKDALVLFCTQYAHL